MSDNHARALDGTLNRTPRPVVPVEPVDPAARLTDLDGRPRTATALMAAGLEREMRQRKTDK